MNNTNVLILSVDFYDKSKHEGDDVPPKFRIILDNLETSVYTEKEIINNISILLAERVNPQLYEFRKINLENKLKGEEFYTTNNILKNIIDIYNKIETVK